MMGSATGKEVDAYPIIARQTNLCLLGFLFVVRLLVIVVVVVHQGVKTAGPFHCRGKKKKKKSGPRKDNKKKVTN
jgi:hypothetical protein